MTVEREVLYKLKVQGDSQGGRAFEDLSKRAKQLEQDANRAGKAASAAARGGSVGGGGFVNPASATGGSRAGGGGGGGESVFAGFAPALASVTVAAVAMQKGLEAATNAVKAFNDKTLTASASNARLVESLVPFSQTFGNLFRAILKVDEQFAAVAKNTRDGIANAERSAAATAAKRDRMQSINDVYYRGVGAKEAAEVLRDDPGLRRDLGDERFRGQAEAKVEALRNQFGAEEKATDALVALAKAQEEANRASGKVEHLAATTPSNQNIGDWVDQLEAAKKIEKLQAAIVNEKNALNRLSQAEVAAENAVAAAMQKKHEAAKADVALAREKLKAVQEEGQAYRTSAVAFGKLRANERAVAVLSAKQLRDQGVDSLTDHQRDLLGRTGMFNKQFEESAIRAAESDSAFKEALGIAGQRDIKEITKDKLSLEQKVNVNVNLSEEELAKNIVDKMAPMVKDAFVTIDRITNNDRIRQEIQERAGQLQVTR